MMKQTYSRGFTLIELLVVIAIIGILASVVLASLNSARDKGADAAVKSNLDAVKKQAAIFYEDNGASYSGLCADARALEAFSGARNAVSGTVAAGGLGDGGCVDGTSDWAAWVNLKTDPTRAWCVDSTGASVEIAAQDSSTAALTACP